EDLKEAIKKGKRAAANIIPKDYIDFIEMLNSLETKLSYRYKYIGKIEDFKEAILVVNITPKDYLNFIGRLNNLGNKLSRYYKYIEKIKDLKEAI
ncbi:uncharacterized protein K441DRAFT_567233, partial [Cenococcum geophilum 1.58]|uniref:uncharacterized protein n=1 Tax=Cenococcum geophilum 1.58 TaxID=794803 RepID=UPI00358FA82E